MLADKKLKAFVAATNAVKARSFYQGTLGLKLIAEDDYGLDFEVNGSLLRVALVRELAPQAFTVLGWNVGDIASVIRSLNAGNIFCERYDFLEQDELCVWTSPNGSKVAWFKDPEGNILSLTQ